MLCVLYENERWVPGVSTASASTSGGADDTNKAKTMPEGTWSKAALKPGERKPWTRGRDGWSGVADDGSHQVR